MKMLIALFALLLLLGCEESEEKIEGSVNIIGLARDYNVLSAIEVIDSSDTSTGVSVNETLKAIAIAPGIFMENDSLFFIHAFEYDSTGYQLRKLESREDVLQLLGKYETLVLEGNINNDSLFSHYRSITDSSLELKYFKDGEQIISHSLLQRDELLIVEIEGITDTLKISETGTYSDTIIISSHPNYSEIVFAYNYRILNAGPYSYDRIHYSNLQ